MEKIMLIVNPRAGRKEGERLCDRVVGWFRKGGGEVSLFLTAKPRDATDFVLRDGRSHDVIVCMGGDGTLNEVINGILRGRLDIPLGYIPAGSTNDFATSMRISHSPQQAVTDILRGRTRTIDAGQFNDRYFSYVASFGAFTRTSYNTPQDLKNLLGRFAYFLEGARDISDIHPESMRVTAGGRVFEGDYAFGAISNSHSIGGLVRYANEEVDISDEKLEMLLIRMPDSLGILISELHSLNHQLYIDSPHMDFCRADRFEVASEHHIDWSLDGELYRAERVSVVSCIKNRLRFIIP